MLHDAVSLGNRGRVLTVDHEGNSQSSPKSRDLVQEGRAVLVRGEQVCFRDHDELAQGAHRLRFSHVHDPCERPACHGRTHALGGGPLGGRTARWWQVKLGELNQGDSLPCCQRAFCALTDDHATDRIALVGAQFSGHALGDVLTCFHALDEPVARSFVTGIKEGRDVLHEHRMCRQPQAVRNQEHELAVRMRARVLGVHCGQEIAGSRVASRHIDAARVDTHAGGGCNQAAVFVVEVALEVQNGHPRAFCSCV